MMQQSVINLTNEELYLEYLKSNNPLVLDKIALKNKYYIRSLANRVYEGNIKAYFNGCVIEASDLEQEGYIGFRKGLERYDINSGYKVITYCKSWALKYMREFYGNYEKTVKIPDSIRRVALKGGDNDIDPSSFKAMVVGAFSLPTVDIDVADDIEHKEFRSNSWYDYFRLITSEFSDKELEMLNILWSEGASSSKQNPHLRAIIRRIKHIYTIIESQTTFLQPLMRHSECIMDLETYEFWLNGYCGDEFYKYKAIDIFLIEKERLEFEVYNKKDYVILKL